MRGISSSNLLISNVANLKDQMVEINEPYTAKNIFQQLVQRIKRFEKSLDQEHEVGMQLVSFGQSTQFSVTQIGYMDPSIILFEGILSDESNVELVQHISQISFLMIAVKRQNSEEPRSPIGFYRPDQQTTSQLPESDLVSDRQEEVASTIDPE
jgi:hypothetical protein